MGLTAVSPTLTPSNSTVLCSGSVHVKPARKTGDSLFGGLLLHLVS